MEPIGSGPYRLQSATTQKIVLERHDDYWGKGLWGLPVPRYVVHVIYKGNESGNLALESGDVDVSQQFVPQIWKMWEGGKPVGAWFGERPYFYVGGSMPSLIFNLHRRPMSDPAFRRAVAYALDYANIAELAMTRYSPTMVPGLISKFGREEEFFDQALVDEMGWEYNPPRAETVLRQAGYTKADGGWAMPDGTPVPSLAVECPHGWTDWVSTLRIVSQNLREIGLDVRAEFPEYPPFNDRVQQGDFDMVMYNPSGSYSPAQPWLKFRNSMSAVGVQPIGEGRAFWNWGRYQDDDAEALLEQIPMVSDDAERKALYRELNTIFMRDIPVLPLEYRPWIFYSFNTTWWENFPTSDNDYAPPQLLTEGAGIRAIYKIRPTGRTGK
jgi:peptide/nickel transport system substrate-binding protein